MESVINSTEPRSVQWFYHSSCYDACVGMRKVSTVRRIEDAVEPENVLK